MTRLFRASVLFALFAVLTGAEGECNGGGAEGKDPRERCGEGTTLQGTECVAVNAPPQSCAPKCDGRTCGSDGCDGVCGECGNDEQCKWPEGVCEKKPCTKRCAAGIVECGDDGCGGSCGTCESGKTCKADTVSQFGSNVDRQLCQVECKPDCYNDKWGVPAHCGSDGCGGSCGTCATGESCDTDKTVCVAPAWKCDPSRYNDGQKCDCECGLHDPDCSTSGLDTIGCKETYLCYQGSCYDPVPAGWTGPREDYLDLKVCHCNRGAIDGDCIFQPNIPVVGCLSNVCQSNGTCAPCTPNCTGKNCGDDGCGGICTATGPGPYGPTGPSGDGRCYGGDVCKDGSCTNPCAGAAPILCQANGGPNNCGADGCGGSCGTCTGAQDCLNGTCVDETTNPAPDSCAGRCGSPNTPSGCACDRNCATRGDCCADKTTVCPLVTAPSNLAYTVNPAVYVLNTPITENKLTYTGTTAGAFMIAPALPAGVEFDYTNGSITGTPTAATPMATYTISAGNSVGTGTVTLTLSVIEGPPTGLTYGSNPVAYTRTQMITANNPSFTGGTPSSYSVMPSLPAGLVLDSVTGVISGTPTVTTPTAIYTITASNLLGSTMANLTLTVNELPPAGLSYSLPAAYTRTVAITPASPSSTGGPVDSYSVNPPLPAGLALSPTTGVISGTPTVIDPAGTDYTITATNTGGSTNTIVHISINDLPPTSLVYSADPAIYTRTVAITANTPSNSGGAVVGYSVLPPLPAGLALDMNTGVISGTPTVIAPVANYTVTAINSGGFTTTDVTITVNDLAPTALAYSTNPAVYNRNVAITNNTPSNSGGVVVTYGVAPSLPTGLALNPSSGVISGTPGVTAPTGTYTVTATNSGGFTTANVVITVNEQPPAGLSYLTSSMVLTINSAATANNPSSTGGPIASYSVSPALPTGLSVHPTTGVISGTPTVLAAAANYTITATNSGGTTQAVVNVRVNDIAPANLSYSTNPASYTRTQAIAANSPSSTGGAVVSYGVAPALPAGLSIATGSGVITGTPTVVAPTGTYVITATNTGGSTNANLVLAVNDLPPTALVYSSNPAVYTRTVAITNNTPSNSGGAVVSYSVAPPLPTGLSLNTGSGVISGTPGVIAPSGTYTVTATNSGGSTNTGVSITVNDLPPTSLVYAPAGGIFPQGSPITLTPSTGGGAVLSWGISPALPSGLSFNTGNGVISGTPNASSPATDYTITATNSGGFTDATISISILGSWVHEAYVKASNADDIMNETADQYGAAIAIDGNTLVVGAPFERSGTTAIINGPTGPTDNTAPVSGAVYVYRRTGGIWEQEAFLKAPNAEAQDMFGKSVAISGDTIVVGAIGEASSATTITNGTTASGDNGATGAGAAYVFRRSGTTWAQEAYLKASNAGASDQFGWSVAIDGDTIVVGANLEAGGVAGVVNGAPAPADDSNASTGAAYVFTRSGAAWSEQAYLKPGFIAPTPDGIDEQFGNAVSVSGNTIIVGAVGDGNPTGGVTNGAPPTYGPPGPPYVSASGAAHVFLRTGNNWAQQAYLKHPVPDDIPLENFGYAVSIDGDTAIVGVLNDDSDSNQITNGTGGPTGDNGTGYGAAVVFKRSGVTWSQQAFFKPANTPTTGNYGSAVFVHGDVAVVGAYGDRSSSNVVINGTGVSNLDDSADIGAAFVYSRTTNTWTQAAYLKAPNARVNSGAADRFGFSVAYASGPSGSFVAVGADRESNRQNWISQGPAGPTSDTGDLPFPNDFEMQGAAYVFTY